MFGCVYLVLRRRQIKKIGDGGGWVFDVFGFWWLYAAAAADQNGSAAAAARCSFSGVGVWAAAAGRSR
jgi:hypothetical protein